MKAFSQDDKELRKIIYKLRTALRDDMRQIREVENQSPLIPLDARQKFTKLERLMREKAVRNMSHKELLSTYRQLEYIRNLKSSTLRGALETAEKFSPIKEHLSSFSEEKRKEWWSVYGEIYKHASTMEQYKYDIFQVVDQLFGNMDTKEIINDMIEEYDKILESGRGNISDEKVSLLFSEKLRDLLDKIR